MKTLIAIPSMDQVPAQFAQSLATLNKPGDCIITFQIGSLIYASRNELAKKAVQMGADFIFWLDSDMLFDPNTLTDMMQTLQEQKLDILTGLYFRRVPPFSPVLFDKLDIKASETEWHNMETVPDKLFEVEGCGFGCVLMRTEILLSIMAKNNNLFAPIGNVGEDLSFCWRARNTGYKIYCDPRVTLGHVGHTIITKEFYENYQMAKEAMQ